MKFTFFFYISIFLLTEFMLQFLDHKEMKGYNYHIRKRLSIK